jgi:hypothetical protein
VERSSLKNNVHAEMKLLNWVSKNVKVGACEFYVSKLCCTNCSIAIEEWNKQGRTPRIEAPESHGNYFVGWEFPFCINSTTQLGENITKRILKQQSLTGGKSKDIRGRSRVVNDKSQRELSPSPPPRGAPVKDYSHTPK